MITWYLEINCTQFSCLDCPMYQELGDCYILKITDSELGQKIKKAAFSKNYLDEFEKILRSLEQDHVYEIAGVLLNGSNKIKKIKIFIKSILKVENLYLSNNNNNAKRQCILS